MRVLLGMLGVVAAALTAGGALAADTRADPRAATEDYVRAPMPPGFQVVNTALEGPVFADAGGKTLYRWPSASLRNGDAGEQKGKPTCDNHKYTENAGLMSPYPGGLVLPEVETRPSCTDVWPPVLATADAKSVGKWTVVARPDGGKQWAYDGYALYTSVLDHRSGDTLGGSKQRMAGEGGAVRQPVSPEPNAPAQFRVYPMAQGHLLGTSTGFSVYARDKDGPNLSTCDAACLTDWSPVLAPQTVEPEGEWSVVESSPGVRQWAYRKKPLYTRIADERFRSYEGSDVPGWHNVFTMTPPPPPKGFTAQDTRSGQVLADGRGLTIYVYNCNDDAVDQLACNHPDTPQEYRFAICGKGDPAKCLETFPYLTAPKDAKGDGKAWTVMEIDPQTGRRANAGQAGALRVWAYRDRPVYSCFRDHKPGDIECDSWGEFNGWRNGYKAFWLRDDFRNNAG